MQHPLRTLRIRVSFIQTYFKKYIAHSIQAAELHFTKLLFAQVMETISKIYETKEVATALTNPRHFGMRSMKNFGTMFVSHNKKLSHPHELKITLTGYSQVIVEYTVYSIHG